MFFGRYRFGAGVSMPLDPNAHRVESYKKRSNVGGEVLVRVLEDSSEPAPTVVLFGWFGAKLKHVGKYAQRWEALGCSTVCCVASTSVVFSLNHRNVPRFLLSVLSIVAADRRLLDGGIIMQFFSNGGAVCAPVLSALFAGKMRDLVPSDAERTVKAIQSSLAAVVFDSAPCYMHEHMGADAFMLGLGVTPGTWLASIIRAVYMFWTWLQHAWYGDLATRFWLGVRDADYGCPELYMYSTDDPLTDAARIEALIIERRASCKHAIYEMKVESASHVKIMLRYPDEYKCQLEGVLDWGVANWRKKKTKQTDSLPNARL